MTYVSREPELPTRPYIPPTLWIFVSVFCVEVAVLGGLHYGYLIAISFAFLCLITLFRHRVPGIRALGIAVIVAGSIGLISAQAALRQRDALITQLKQSAVSSWDLRIAQDPMKTEVGKRCLAEIGRNNRWTGKVWLSLPDSSDAQRGDILCCVGRFSEARDDSWGIMLKLRTIAGRVNATYILEHQKSINPLIRFRRYVLSAIDPHSSQERALLAGIVCGYRSALSEFKIDETLARCGLAHMVAVSGSHLSILAALLAQVLERLHLSVRKRLVALALATMLFVALCGFPASALRAWAMTLSSYISWGIGRRSHSVSAACMAAITMCILNPGVCGEIGFQLSVLSVLGLCLLSRYGGYVLQVALPTGKVPRLIPRRLKKRYAKARMNIRAACVSSVVAQLSCAPVSIPVFGSFSLLAPISNAVIGPVFTAAISLGCLAALIGIVPGVGAIALAVSDVICGTILHLVAPIAHLKLASVAVDPNSWVVPALSASLLLVCLVVWPRLKRIWVHAALGAMASLGLLCILAWGPFAPARLIVADVGQGDMIVVQDGISCVVVDTGPDPDLSSQVLTRNHILHLDALIITHLHDDHTAGAQAIAEQVWVDEVVVAKGVTAKKGSSVERASDLSRAGELHHISAGDTIRVGNFEFLCIWPEVAVDGSENEHSLMFVVTYKKHGKHMRILLTGDAEHNELEALFTQGRLGEIDVLKVGHHGSAISIDPEQAQALRATVALASAGKDNSYGHPTKEAIDALYSAHTPLYCTIEASDIEVRPERSGVGIRTRKPCEPRSASP